MIQPRQQPEHTTNAGGVGGAGGVVLDEKTAVPPKAKPARKIRTVPHQSLEALPPWRVLLHNDDVNEMEYVARTIAALTPLSLKVAIHCMLEAHLRGLTLLLITHQERAELYREQFRTKSLTVTIEAVEGCG